MFYDFARRPSCNIVIYALTGYTDHWIIIKDNGYIVNAFDEFGNEIEPWINTNKDIAEKNKLEKLFKKLGFKSL